MARGQVERSSLPSKPGAPQRWRSYRHDGLDRQILLTKPDGGTVVTRYDVQDGLTSVETLDEARHRTVSLLDAFGNEIHRDRHDGFVRMRTTYSYDVLNRLIDIRDGRGSTIWYANDGHGNRIFEADPDLGCRTRSYDTAGRLTHQAAADGTRLTYSYDAVGRVLAKTVDKEALQFSNCRFEIVIGSRTETGSTGNDVLDAGTGRLSDVVLNGGAGNDNYLIGSDSGSVILDHNAENASGGQDTVRFKDLTQSDLTISYYSHGNSNGEALKFAWTGLGTRSAGQHHIANRAEHIERFELPMVQ